MTTIDRDAVAEQSLQDWHSLYENIRALLELLPKDKRGHAVTTLREAHDLLQRLAPVLRMDRWIPTTTIQIDERKEALNIGDFLAAGSLLSIADWLDRRVPKRGPPATMGIIAQAAVELSEISKAAAKGPDWKWVQVKLEDKFGNDVPKGSALRTLAQKAREWKLRGLRNRLPSEPFKLFPEPRLGGEFPKEDDASEEAVKTAVQRVDTHFTLYNIRWRRDQALAAAREKPRKNKKQLNVKPRKPHRYEPFKGVAKSRG